MRSNSLLLLGGVLAVVGLFVIPGPGPGALVVAIGLAIIATGLAWQFQNRTRR